VSLEINCMQDSRLTRCSFEFQAGAGSIYNPSGTVSQSISRVNVPCIRGDHSNETVSFRAHRSSASISTTVSGH
jgi:hypothetical protein